MDNSKAQTKKPSKFLKSVKEVILSKDGKREIRANILQNDDGTIVVLDVRKYRDDKGTREGISLFYTELEWIYEKFRTRQEGVFVSNNNKRTVTLARVWTDYSLTVRKGRKLMELDLTSQEIDRLKEGIPMVLDMLRQYIQNDLKNTYLPVKKTIVTQTRNWDTWTSRDDVKCETKTIDFM